MGHIMVQIEFKYLRRTRNRHGKFYYSFRKKGHKRVRIPGAPGSAEFVAAYESALGMSTDEKKLNPGSMAALVNLFYASTKFAGLDKKSTQRTYRRVLDNFCDEHGDKPVALLQMHHMDSIIAKKCNTPAAANQLLKRVKQVLDFGVKHGWIKTNPAKGVEKIKYSAKPIHTWTEEQAAQFVKRHRPGSRKLVSGSLQRSWVTGLLRAWAAQIDCNPPGGGRRKRECNLCYPCVARQPPSLALHKSCK